MSDNQQGSIPGAKGHQGFENMPKEAVSEIGRRGQAAQPDEAKRVGGLVSRGGLTKEEAYEKVRGESKESGGNRQ